MYSVPWRVRYFPDVRKNHIVARESLRKMASYTEIRFSKSSKRNNNSAERIETYRTNSIETLDISARLETRSIVWPTGITPGDTASPTKTRRNSRTRSLFIPRRRRDFSTPVALEVELPTHTVPPRFITSSRCSCALLANASLALVQRRA